MNSTSVGLGLPLAALLVVSCSTPTPRESPSNATATAIASPDERRLPLVSGPPEQLEPGTYLTPEGFEPVISITVPDGWFGGAGGDSFGVGQGNDEINQRFEDVGLYVSVIDMPYADAVEAFPTLTGLVHEAEPVGGTIDGYETTTFRAHAGAGHVVLDPIAPGSDIGPEGDRQIFIDVDGTTIFVKTEVFDETALPALDGVLASLEFPN